MFDLRQNQQNFGKSGDRDVADRRDVSYRTEPHARKSARAHVKRCGETLHRQPHTLLWFPTECRLQPHCDTLGSGSQGKAPGSFCSSGIWLAQAADKNGLGAAEGDGQPPRLDYCQRWEAIPFSQVLVKLSLKCHC